MNSDFLTNKELEQKLQEKQAKLVELKHKEAQKTPAEREAERKQLEILNERIRVADARTAEIRAETALIRKRTRQAEAAQPTVKAWGKLRGEEAKAFGRKHSTKIKSELACVRRILDTLKAEGLGPASTVPKTPHLDHYDTLSPGEKTKYYRQHKKEIKAELRAEIAAEKKSNR